jgi:hypothetical protein
LCLDSSGGSALRREHWHARLRRPGSEPPMPSAPAGAGDQGTRPNQACTLVCL